MTSPKTESTNSNSVVYTREMTITHADFIRLVPKALKGFDYKLSGSTITLNGPQGEGTISIHLSPESTRKIGSFRLPVTRVDLKFAGLNTEIIENFMVGFDRSYQKGGG